VPKCLLAEYLSIFLDFAAYLSVYSTTCNTTENCILSGMAEIISKPMEVVTVV